MIDQVIDVEPEKRILALARFSSLLSIMVKNNVPLPFAFPCKPARPTLAYADSGEVGRVFKTGTLHDDVTPLLGGIHRLDDVIRTIIDARQGIREFYHHFNQILLDFDDREWINSLSHDTLQRCVDRLGAIHMIDRDMVTPHTMMCVVAMSYKLQDMHLTSTILEDTLSRDSDDNDEIVFHTFEDDEDDEADAVFDWIQHSVDDQGECTFGFEPPPGKFHPDGSRTITVYEDESSVGTSYSYDGPNVDEDGLEAEHREQHVEQDVDIWEEGESSVKVVDDVAEDTIHNVLTGENEGWSVVDSKIQDFIKKLMSFDDNTEISYQILSNTLLGLLAYHDERVWVRTLSLLGVGFNLTMSHKLLGRTWNIVSRTIFGTDDPIIASSILRDSEDNTRRQSLLKLLSLAVLPFCSSKDLPECVIDEITTNAGEGVRWSEGPGLVLDTFAYLTEAINHFKDTGSFAGVFSHKAGIKHLQQLMTPIRYAHTLHKSDKNTDIDPHMVMREVSVVVEYALKLLDRTTDTKVVTEINRMVDIAIDLAAEMNIIVRGSQPVIVPYSDAFYGSSSVGKTSVQAQAAHINGFLMMGDALKSSQLQVFTGDEKYSPLRATTKVGILEDFANAIINAGTDNQNPLIDYLSNAAHPENKARLEEKDRIFHNLVYMAISTNHWLFQSDKRSICPVSMIRRVRNIWDVKVKKEYRKHENVNMLDSGKVEQDPTKIQDLWLMTCYEAEIEDTDGTGMRETEFGEVPVVTQPKWRLVIKKDHNGQPLEDVSFHQAIAFWIEDVKIFLRAQQFVVSYIKNMAGKRPNLETMVWEEPEKPLLDLARLPLTAYITEESTGLHRSHIVDEFTPKLWLKDIPRKIRRFIYKRLDRQHFKMTKGHTEYRLHGKQGMLDYALEFFGVDTDILVLRERLAYLFTVVITCIGKSKFFHPLTWVPDASFSPEVSKDLLYITNSNTILDTAYYEVVKDSIREFFQGLVDLALMGVLVPLRYVFTWIYWRLPKTSLFSKNWNMLKSRFLGLILVALIVIFVCCFPLIITCWWWSHTVWWWIYLLWPAHIVASIVVRIASIFRSMDDERDFMMDQILYCRKLVAGIREGGTPGLIAGQTAVACIVGGLAYQSMNNRYIVAIDEEAPHLYEKTKPRYDMSVSTPEEIRHVIRPNIIRCYSQPFVHMLALNEHLWVVAGHAIDYGEEAFEFTGYTGYDVGLQKHTITVYPRDVFRVGETDLTFIRAPKRLPVADIVHLVREIDEDRDKVATVVHVDQGGATRAESGMITNYRTNAVADSGAVSPGITYNMDLYAGACGAPVIIEGKRGKIVALHGGVLKDDRGRRTAMELTPRSILAAMDHFEMHPTATRTPKIVLENPGEKRRNSPLRRLEERGELGPDVEYVGSLDYQTHYKSAAKRTSIAPKLTELGIPDTHKDQFAGRKWYEPMEAYLEAATKHTPDLDPKLLYMAVRDYTDPLLKIPSTRSAYGIGDAINGVPGSFAASGIEMQTGGCVHFPGKKKNYLTLKDGKYIADPHLIFHIKRVERELAMQVEPFEPVNANVKVDEVLTFSDGKVKMPRMIMGTTFAMLINSIRFLGPIFDFLIENRWISEIGLGLNMYADVPKLDDYLTQGGRWKVTFLDVSKFDRTRAQNLKHATSTVMITIAHHIGFTAAEVAVVAGIMRTFVEVLTFMSGDIFRLKTTNASGLYGTGFTNGIEVSLEKRVAFFSLYPDKDFREFVKLITNGDDTGEGYKTGLFGRPICGKFTNTYQQEWFAKHGVKITPAAKYETVQEWCEEWMFLARGNRVVGTKFGKTRVGPLRDQSLFKRLYWQVDSQLTELEHYAISIPEVLLELSLWGEEKYEFYRAKLKMIDYGLTIEELEWSWKKMFDYYLVERSEFSVKVNNYAIPYAKAQVYTPGGQQSGPKYTEVQIFEESPKEELKKPEGAKRFISGTATAVAEAAGILKELPFMSVPMTATQVAAKTTASIASLMGFSKPSSIVAPTQTISTYNNMSVVNTIDNVFKLSADIMAERPVTTGEEGGDPLSFEGFIEAWTLFKTYPWKSSDSVTTQVIRMRVDPCLYRLLKISSAVPGSTGLKNAYCLTRLGELCFPFMSWTGDIHYKLKIIAPINIGGVLRVIYDPVIPPVTGAPFEAVSSYIWDVSKEREIEIVIKPGQPHVLMDHTFTRRGVLLDTPTPKTVFPPVPRVLEDEGIGYYDWSEYNSPDYDPAIHTPGPLPTIGNGYMAVEVLSRLQGAFNMPLDNVTIKVSVKGGSNFRVFKPSPDLSNFAPTYINEEAGFEEDRRGFRHGRPESFMRKLEMSIALFSITVLSVSLGAGYYFLPRSWFTTIADWGSRRLNDAIMVITRPPSETDLLATPRTPSRLARRRPSRRTHSDGDIVEIREESGDDGLNIVTDGTAPDAVTISLMEEGWVETREESSVHLGLFLEREFLVGTYDWTLGEVTTKFYNPWSLMLTNETLRDKLKHTHGFRSNLEIRLRASCSPYVYGEFILAYFPVLNDQFCVMKYHNTSTNAKIVPTILSKGAHTFLELGSTQDVILKVPFLLDKDFMDLTETTDAQRMGRIAVAAVAPPDYAGQDATGVVVRLTLSVRFVDYSFQGTTMETLATYIDEEAIPLNDSNVPRGTPLLYNGEYFHSFRPYIKRATPLTGWFSGDYTSEMPEALVEITQMTMPTYRGYRKETADYVPNNTSFMTYIYSMFLGCRGGTRWHIYADNTNAQITAIRRSSPSAHFRVAGIDVDIPTTLVSLTEGVVQASLGRTANAIQDCTQGAQTVSNGSMSIEVPHQTDRLYQFGRRRIPETYDALTFVFKIDVREYTNYYLYVGAADDFTVVRYMGLPPFGLVRMGDGPTVANR